MRTRIYYFLVFLINSFPFVHLLKLVRPFFQNFLHKRSRLKAKNIFELSKNIPLGLFVLTTPELHKSNDWYGHATLLKKYAGLPNVYRIHAAIEHGPFFGNFIWPQDIENSLPAIITFSKTRAQILIKKTHKKIFSIGPYIHYANYYATKRRLATEKKKLGNNLLVFPVHSTNEVQREYDIDELCQEIKKVGKSFDTIRICLYWKDIKRGLVSIYEKYGFTCVTAGHVFDPVFLSRLKSMVYLSSATMSNSVGTQLGYSVFMKKPHYIFRQKVSFKGGEKDTSRALTAANTIQYKNLVRAFSKPNNNITSGQYVLANSFYGFDQIKTPKQLKRIFQEIEKL